MADFDINDIDFSNMGSWPPAAKAAVVGLLCGLVAFGVFWFDTKSQLNELDTAQTQEQQLRKTLKTKWAKAVNLDAYKAQMKEMEDSFGTMLRQLPSKTEVADLLVDITQTGLASGLNFNLFRPGNEVPRDFYAELPIAIQVDGTYHQFGQFVSGVAALPRIVTLDSITIERTKDKLVLNARAKTYRYLDAEELAKKGRSAKKKKRKRR